MSDTPADKTRAMTSAEYRTLREACGLSAREAAAFHGVAVRTIVHWETGRNGVPAGAARELKLLNFRIEDEVSEAALLQHDERAVAVELTRYRTVEDYYAVSRHASEGLPHACHDALIGRTMLALWRMGARVSVTWHGPGS